MVCLDLSDSFLPQNQDIPRAKSVEGLNNIVAIMQIIANYILSINISRTLFKIFFLGTTS